MKIERREEMNLREKIAEIVFNVVVDRDKVTHDSLLNDYGIDIGEYRPWGTLHEMAKKRYLKEADQILSLMREGIKKELLTSDEVWAAYGVDATDGDIGGIAEAQFQKILKAFENPELLEP